MSQTNQNQPRRDQDRRNPHDQGKNQPEQDNELVSPPRISELNNPGGPLERDRQPQDPKKPTEYQKQRGNPQPGQGNKQPGQQRNDPNHPGNPQR